MQLERASDRGMQNDQIPGFNLQLDEDDYHFQPHSISILPSEGKKTGLSGTRLIFLESKLKISDFDTLIRGGLDSGLQPRS